MKSKFHHKSKFPAVLQRFSSDVPPPLPPRVSLCHLPTLPPACPAAHPPSLPPGHPRMPSSQHAVAGQRLSETHPRLARLSSSHQPRIFSPTSMQGEQTDIYDTIYSVRWSLRNATCFNPDYGDGVGSIYRSTLCVSPCCDFAPCQEMEGMV